MYVGLDFLIDKKGKIFLTEVNTGLPGGAQEYDFVYRQRFNKPSGVFNKIEDLSIQLYRKDFKSYINGLTYLNDLKRLKTWMDGQGSIPERFHPVFRLEDKWVQYLLLSKKYPMADTCIYKDNIADISPGIFSTNRLVLKKRYGRGGYGFKIIEQKDSMRVDGLPLDGSYLCQSYIDSSVGSKYGPLQFSLRAAAFSGSFICMFANLSENITSNHGIRTFVSKGDEFVLKDTSFKKMTIIKKAWEADIFFGDSIPQYLHEKLYKEVISDTELTIPKKTYQTIVRYAEEISLLYTNIVLSELPECYLENI